MVEISSGGGDYSSDCCCNGRGSQLSELKRPDYLPGADFRVSLGPRIWLDFPIDFLFSKQTSVSKRRRGSGPVLNEI